MTTAVFEVARSITGRIGELERFVLMAVREEPIDDANYGSLCRACCILLASHLEGFLKDLTSSLTADLNFYLKSFSKLPSSLQRAFCEKIAFFDGVPKEEIDLRVRQLTEFFNENSVNINLQAFSYKEPKNKNPSADDVESVLEKIGIPSVLFSISGSKLETVFSGDTASSYLVRREIRRYRSHLFKFPYRPLPNKYTFNYRSEKTRKSSGGASIWHTYIDEVMQRRYRIAHGDTVFNETTIKALQHDIEKMEVLMHALIFSSVAYISLSDI